MKQDPTSQQFFEEKYRTDPDPWKFLTSEYEQGRYQTTLRAIGAKHYGRTFEPGCSLGVLTVRLAEISSAVEAMDISPTAVEKAQERCKHLRNVRVTCGTFPDDMPPGKFDLLVLSEIGYYFKEEHLKKIGRQMVEVLEPGGTLVAAHWLGKSKDHLLTGDRVHKVLGAVKGLVHTHGERHPGFRLDCWERA